VSGFFVSVDGPSGVGKSTTISELHAELTRRGFEPRRTTEPPKTALGDFTRQHVGEITGFSLACLVAAARYQHIEDTIAPAMERGELLISDRYVASTLVLQRLDGVPLNFLVDVNRYARNPELAVILTATPDTIAERIAGAGVTHRFRDNPDGPAREVRLYQEAASLLADRGVNVLRLDSSTATPSEVADRIADAITARRLPSVPSQALRTPLES
jgi:dTMP kinase